MTPISATAIDPSARPVLVVHPTKAIGGRRDLYIQYKRWQALFWHQNCARAVEVNEASPGRLDITLFQTFRLQLSAKGFERFSVFKFDKQQWATYETIDSFATNSVVSSAYNAITALRLMGTSFDLKKLLNRLVWIILDTNNPKGSLKGLPCGRVCPRIDNTILTKKILPRIIRRIFKANKGLYRGQKALTKAFYLYSDAQTLSQCLRIHGYGLNLSHYIQTAAHTDKLALIMSEAPNIAPLLKSITGGNQDVTKAISRKNIVKTLFGPDSTFRTPSKNEYRLIRSLPYSLYSTQKFNTIYRAIIYGGLASELSKKSNVIFTRHPQLMRELFLAFTAINTSIDGYSRQLNQHNERFLISFLDRHHAALKWFMHHFIKHVSGTVAPSLRGQRKGRIKSLMETMNRDLHVVVDWLYFDHLDLLTLHSKYSSGGGFTFGKLVRSIQEQNRRRADQKRRKRRASIRQDAILFAEHLNRPVAEVMKFWEGRTSFEIKDFHFKALICPEHLIRHAEEMRHCAADFFQDAVEGQIVLFEVSNSKSSEVIGTLALATDLFISRRTSGFRYCTYQFYGPENEIIDDAKAHEAVESCEALFNSSCTFPSDHALPTPYEASL